MPAATAALCNGYFGHVLEFDDTHDDAALHAGSAAIPAALATAGLRGSVSGREFCEAVLLGIELTCRLGVATRLNLVEGGWIASAFNSLAIVLSLFMGLLLVRFVAQGPLPERLLPTAFILIAPPAVSGTAVLQLGAPDSLGWLFWGMALFALGWAATLARRLQPLAFSVMHWALSFPLAALASLTLRLAQPGGLLAVLGPVLLALCSLIILGLLMATWRGLRDGREGRGKQRSGHNRSNHGFSFLPGCQLGARRRRCPRP